MQVTGNEVLLHGVAGPAPATKLVSKSLVIKAFAVLVPLLLLALAIHLRFSPD